MFGKDKKEIKEGETETPAEEGEGDISAPPLKPFSRKGSHIPAKPPAAAAPFRTEIPRRPVDIPGAARRTDRGRGADDDANKLFVGRDIRLSGEITCCDRLVVEGQVEVVLSGGKLIEIMPSGLFRGNVDVDEADVSGRFEGELIAREKLTVRAGGKVSGSVRYGKVVIEAGGEITGDMRSLTDEELRGAGS